MSAVQINKSRRNLLIVLAVFVLPVVIAKLALEQEWFNYGVTNHGQLLSESLTLTDLDIDASQYPEQWLLLYRVNEQCDDICQQALVTLNSAYVLLGKEIPRVTPITLNAKPLSLNQKESLKHGKWQQHALTEQALSHIQPGQLVVVDPLGNLVMTHNTPNNNEELTTFGKALIADMKKLLKYSKVG